MILKYLVTIFKVLLKTNSKMISRTKKNSY